ncbi:MAG: helix-turn-helix transcriptional regulator [Xanthobacteraceae bacterium]|nr:helix-turn-helix transcriptional regulator [Xanthobacteraceae bacterium]
MKARASSARSLREAISDLGDAVLDPRQWPFVMEHISRAAGATGAFLVQADARTPDVPRTDSLRGFVDDYFRNGWHARDVRAARGAPVLLSGSHVVIDQDILTREQIAKEPLYNDCNLKHGLAWFAGVKVWAGPALWAMAIQRSVTEGPFNKAEKELLGLLSRPLSEAATLSATVGGVTLSSATCALDSVGEPAIALGRYGLVLGTNAAAEKLFDDDFRLKDRRLCVKDRDANRRLCELADRLTMARDTDPLVESPIMIRRVSKPPLIAGTIPIHGAARTPFLGARALLIFRSTNPGPPVAPVLLSELFGLTPAEARVAAMIADGRRPNEIARRLAISRGTVKNQLKVVFQKTSVHRQAELAALLARLPRT